MELCHIQLSGKILLNLSVEMKERVPCGNDQESRMRSLSGLKQYVSVSKLQVWKILHLGESGEGGTHSYKLYRYVPPHRVGFWPCFGLQTGIRFPYFGLESGMVFEGTTGVYERFNSKWVRNREIYHNNDVQSVFSWAPKVVGKCESKHWFSYGADGRSLGRAVSVRSRDYQIFWDG